MNPDKNKQEQENPADKADATLHTIRQNPNERANENIPEEKRKEDAGNDEGVGSEITDGEDG